jgi:hypothetical protein
LADGHTGRRRTGVRRTDTKADRADGADGQTGRQAEGGCINKQAEWKLFCLGLERNNLRNRYRRQSRRWADR